ncbi:Hypothetical predicted protein [Octopus vulgaris]|uniref:Uncharacterized protein n=1 Tax=Octopus vulgaris TaxID=6645 RepID=A0AA36F3J5_OCTVU|nr:Hypothetical predicted protein [Octopus vulgaris]
MQNCQIICKGCDQIWWFRHSSHSLTHMMHTFAATWAGHTHIPINTTCTHTHIYAFKDLLNTNQSIRFLYLKIANQSMNQSKIPDQIQNILTLSTGATKIVLYYNNDDDDENMDPFFLLYSLSLLLYRCVCVCLCVYAGGI